jgi:nanoRNase/pAp phosphatase (c-di-AMP/oligoRNAs hydrolase)
MFRWSLRRNPLHFKGLKATLSQANSLLVHLHHNADPDAIGSAYALKNLIQHSSSLKYVEIAAPAGISRIGRQIMQHLPTTIVSSPRLDDADVVILVDTSTFIQLGTFGQEIRDSTKPLVIVDHHTPHKETMGKASLRITDDDASSTCEVVYRLYEEARLEPDRDTALALFLGIAYDTRHFIIAKSNTFRTVAKLLGSGLVPEEALPLLAAPLSASERTARLKAAQRLQRTRLGEWIVAESRVGSYQSSAARALLALGADVAIVGGEHKGKVRISLRATRCFYRATHIHLGREIAAPLGSLKGGMGGGHSTAAGINLEGDLDEATKACLRLLRDAFAKTEARKPEETPQAGV